MAFPRYFFALCAVLVFVLVGGIYAELDSESIELNSAELKELRNYYLAEEDGDYAMEHGPILEIIIKILKRLLETAVKNCLKDAAIHCKDQWRNPKLLIACVKQYLKEDEGNCLIG